MRKKERRNKTVLYFILLIILGIATYFGADSLDTQCVSYEEEVNGITQAYAYYAVPKGDGALLVEIAGYVGMPVQIQAKFEEMAGTFVLLQ